MSLRHFIYHAPVGSPTYLDILPAAVISHCIIPFLDWEDRININRITPAGDRTPPNKIPKDRIIGHQLSILAPALSVKVKNANSLYARRASRGAERPPIYQVADAIIAVFREAVKGHNPLLCQHSAAFRSTLARKVAEFSEPANVRAIPRIAQRAEMQDAIHHVLVMMDQMPFKNEVPSQKWKKARVTQNEVAMLHQEWTERGHITRRQGDIYTVWE